MSYGADKPNFLEFWVNDVFPPDDLGSRPETLC